MKSTLPLDISLFIASKAPVDARGAGQRHDVVQPRLNHGMGLQTDTYSIPNLGERAHRPDSDAGAVGHLPGQRPEA